MMPKTTLKSPRWGAGDAYRFDRPLAADAPGRVASEEADDLPVLAAPFSVTSSWTRTVSRSSTLEAGGSERSPAGRHRVRRCPAGSSRSPSTATSFASASTRAGMRRPPSSNWRPSLHGGPEFNPRTRRFVRSAPTAANYPTVYTEASAYMRGKWRGVGAQDPPRGEGTPPRVHRVPLPGAPEATSTDLAWLEWILKAPADGAKVPGMASGGDGFWLVWHPSPPPAIAAG
jgi:hypothetical protein